MNKLLVSPSPHLHTKTSTKSLMRDVVIALLPAVVVSVLFYGWSELLVLGVSVASCVLLEFLITKYLLKGTCTVGDWSAVITGVLLALNLPATTPWWVVLIGAIFAIGVAKMTFGGLGQNLFNPPWSGCRKVKRKKNTSDHCRPVAHCARCLEQIFCDKVLQQYA